MNGKIVLLCLINLYCVYSSPYDLNQLTKRGQRFCGSHLRTMLSLVCHGRYNDGVTKKSLNDILPYDEYEEGAENSFDENELIFPFLRKEALKSLIPRKFRKTVGVVNECCYRSCTTEHMQLYCAPINLS